MVVISFKVMPHVEFMQRVRKSLYFGCDLNGEGSDALQISKPLAEYASELFSESHKGYTLNRLRCTDACNMQTATPATLIMALIYLDRLTVTDPAYVRRITPHELFIVSMVSFSDEFIKNIYKMTLVAHSNNAFFCFVFSDDFSKILCRL